MTTYSRTDAPDLSWADTGPDEGQPQRRQAGMDRGEAESFDPGALMAALPPRGGMAEPTASAVAFDDLGERPSFHESSTPPAVATAWSAVLAALSAATEAERDERALAGQEAQAQRVEAARVRSATAAGKVVKPSPAPDWSGQRRHLEAVSAGHRERARHQRGLYDQLVVTHRDAWAERIVEGLPAAKTSTLDALADVKDRVERLLGAAEAAQSLQLEEGGSVVSLPVLPVRRFIEELQALAEEIAGNEQLAGSSLCRPAMTPSWAERQQMAAGIRQGVVDSGAHWLQALEGTRLWKRRSLSTS